MLIFALIYVAIIGLAVGSFINCFIWRIHQNESLWDRSYCPACHSQIAWYHNIPVLSFLWLKFKCNNCQKNISWQYPLVELVSAALFALIFYFNYSQLGNSIALENIFLLANFDFFLVLFRDWLIVSVAIIIFVYDLRWFIIPDLVILPAILLVFVMNILLGHNILNLFLLLLAGAGFFGLQFLLTRGKGIGGGDIRLGAFMGVALARFDYLIVAILLSYWLGFVVAIGLLISRKKKMNSKLPLGIFLTTGIVITMIWGEAVLDWYLSWL